NVRNHEVRVAAHYQNHRFLRSFDWCLDALYQVKFGSHNYFKKQHGLSSPQVDHDIDDMVVTELLEWGPGLVISDCEFFTAMIAKVLEVPLWYCSPMLQLVGLERERKEIYAKAFERFRVYFDRLPIGDSYFIYSPLCDVQGRPHIKQGFEWVRPYAIKPDAFTSEDIDFSIVEKAIPKSCLLTTGETSFVSDCLYSGKFMFVSPNPKEIEQNLNAQFLEWYGLGKNIGRSNSLSFVKKLVEKPHPKPMLSVQNWKLLDEKIDVYKNGK